MAPGTDVAQGVVLDDRYRLDEIIGQGGMATVYRGHDLVLGRDVAVKLFPPVAQDDDDVQRHESEMHVLAQLSSPGLVTLHDAGVVHREGPVRQMYLVMELVVGETLADRLAGGPLSSVHTARIGRQLAEALAAVHESGVVHRDVKPANILMTDRHARSEHQGAEDPALTTGPVVKLADFGIARLSDGARLTVTGTTLGTATYLSPEQAAGEPVDPPTDVYALGLVLLECLTGQKAFTGSVVEVAAARLNTCPVVPTSLGPDWVDLLVAMTRREPVERPTAAEVAARLARLSGESTGEVPTAAQPVVPGATRESAVTEVPTAAHPTPTTAAAPLTIPPRVAVRRATGDGRPDPVPSPADGTQQLPSAVIRAEAERDASRPRLRPTSTGPVPTSGRRRRGRAGVAAAVVAVSVAGGALLITQPGSTDSAVDAPTYPSVDGPLGAALRDLQRSVEP